MDGTAEKDYKIYVLNSVSTFSSGDVLTAVAKEADNVTIIGENTKGEGLCGHPLCYYLPESKMIFVSVSGVSERDPLNNVIGTEPDIYMGNGLKERMAQEELMNDYDVSELRNNLDLRAKWDKVMKYVLDDIDNSSEK